MKEEHMGKCCNQSCAWFAWLVLVVGVLFLLRDLSVFALSVDGWTALFVLTGLYLVVKSAQ
ncbi:hypothetical protein HYY69_07530 [Candidatus Woesearchaeota archaeon]|nr:hypothetical protein [Candidatus Woesearchaeota archaeon]